jgi:hypothetical protein
MVRAVGPVASHHKTWGSAVASPHAGIDRAVGAFKILAQMHLFEQIISKIAL